MHASTVMDPRDRGAIMRAERASQMALDRLLIAGVGFEPVERNVYRVAGTMMFWPMAGYWRAIDNTAQGYGVETLINHILPKVPA